MQYRYRPMLRPASRWTLPEGIHWTYVEAPWDLTTRDDLPRSIYRYGIIAVDRELTEDEQDRFDLLPA